MKKNSDTKLYKSVFEVTVLSSRPAVEMDFLTLTKKIIEGMELQGVFELKRWETLSDPEKIQAEKAAMRQKKEVFLQVS